MAIQAAVNRTSREEYYFPSSKATTLSEDSAGAGRGAGLLEMPQLSSPPRGLAPLSGRSVLFVFIVLVELVGSVREILV